MDIIDIIREPVPVDDNYVFVMMPFEVSFRKLYDNAILPAVKSKGFECEIADKPTNNAIIHDIIIGIKKSRFIIADVTNQNPNVLYELGIAHALQKEVIIIYDSNSKKLPFDIIYIRARIYSNDAEGWSKLKLDLEDTIEYVRGKIQDYQLTEQFKQSKVEQDKELLFMVQSHFQQRRNRIEYFTYHIIDLMFHARVMYFEMKKMLEDYQQAPTEQKLDIIKRTANSNDEFLRGYIMDFTKFQLDNAKFFLYSAWLSIKFPDELAMLNLEIAGICNANLVQGSYGFHDTINQIIKAIDYRVSRINFSVQIMQEERDRVGLKQVEDKYS